MHLDHALRQISDIRQQMARTEVFRGYRALTVGLSGLAAISAAALQSSWVPSPQLELSRYLGLWISVAALNSVVAGAELYTRVRRTGSGLTRQHTMLAVQQFLPSIAVGALLTFCIFRSAQHVAWMLPGLWSLIYGLGIFSSFRLLPRPVLWVASFYILCGCACLMWGQGDYALSPWLMGISFGGGQLFGAAILYWTLERTNGSPINE